MLVLPTLPTLCNYWKTRLIPFVTEVKRETFRPIKRSSCQIARICILQQCDIDSAISTPYLIAIKMSFIKGSNATKTQNNFPQVYKRSSKCLTFVWSYYVCPDTCVAPKIPLWNQWFQRNIATFKKSGVNGSVNQEKWTREPVPFLCPGCEISQLL